jgi:hypothetical protein
VGDEGYDLNEVAQIRHFNSHATTILLASLCREEYNKVQGLKSAKEIWDVLKTAHEGDEVTKITKWETIEGELGRFILNQGEEPQAMYNRLKTLVNQVRNLGNTKWDDHEMVKVILRSVVFRNPTQVQLIRGDPRYKLMSPEEVIGKFCSFELMIKGSKQIIEQGGTSTPEVQPVAFKATEEESTSSRLPIDASKLDNEEMALIIKSFRQILKQRRGKDYKPRSKKVCYKCGKPGHFIAKCPMSSDSDRGDDKKGRRKEKKKYYKKKGGDAHVCREWDSDMSSTDSSSDEDATNIAVTKGLLFPNVGHKCLMAKDGKNKKVKSRASTKYTTSSDKGSSSDDLFALFANLNMQQKEKLNELIGAIHEKDELLDCQEEFLIKENKKHVKVKNANAQEVEKNENLFKELSTCHDTISNLRTNNAKLLAKVEKVNNCDDSLVNLKNNNASLIVKIDKLNESISSLKIENASLISKAKDLNVCNDVVSNLRNENAILHTKIDELNVCKPSTSTIDHVSICMRCRDINVDAIHDHLALIKQQNDHIAQLTSKVNEHEIKMKNLNLLGACSIMGDALALRMALASNRETISSLMPLRDCPILSRARLPCLRITRVTFYILLVILSIRLGEFMLGNLIMFHTMLFMYKNEASSSRQSTHVKLSKKKSPIASNEPNISFKTFDASYVLTNKSGKVVAKYVGGKHKGSKTCVWVPKVLVSNVKGTKTVWVPKNKA